MCVKRKQHSWRLRVSIAALACVVGMLAALAMLPHIQARMLLNKLASADASVRAAAIDEGCELAARRRQVVDALKHALHHDDNDLRFAGAAAILRAINQYDPGDDTAILDRMHWVALNTSSPAAGASRRLFVHDIVRGGRDNKYVRLALMAAATDGGVQVRKSAALLAARLGDSATLNALLNDTNADVRAEAALSAGLGGNKESILALAAMLQHEENPPARSACLHALMLLHWPSAGKHAASEAWRQWRAGDIDGFDRSINTLLLCGDEQAGDLVLGVLADARRNEALPPPSALSAAGKLGLRQAELTIRQVLRQAINPPEDLLQSHVIAAMQAAEDLSLPVLREVYDICQTLSPPDHSLVFVPALRLLGKQIRIPQPPGAPTRQACLDLLRSWSLNDPPRQHRVQMSLVSAAAAVAYWLAEPTGTFIKPVQVGDDLVVNSTDRRSSAWAVHAALQRGTSLSADYVAWHIGISGQSEALDLGMSLLPPAQNPRASASGPAPRVYSPEARHAGAMLIAISGRRDSTRAIERIQNRLTGGEIGIRPGLRDYHTLTCALHILDGSKGQAVRELLTQGAFPVRRVVTSLCLAGDMWALDWILGDAQSTPNDVTWLLHNASTHEILAACVPDLPQIDDWASHGLRLWQTRIITCHYFINREKLRFASAP